MALSAIFCASRYWSRGGQKWRGNRPTGQALLFTEPKSKRLSPIHIVARRPVTVSSSKRKTSPKRSRPFGPPQEQGKPQIIHNSSPSVMLHLLSTSSRIDRSLVKKREQPSPRPMPERHVRNALSRSHLAKRGKTDNKINEQDKNSDLRRSPENFHRSSFSFAISWSKTYTAFMTNTSDKINHSPRSTLMAATVPPIMLFTIFTAASFFNRSP